MAHDVFLSYASEDKGKADLTCRWLEQNGITCWIAPRDISPGQTYGSAIIEAILATPVMILIFSKSTNPSPQVKREVERAVSNNVAIVPMRIDNVKPQGDLDYFLSAPQWLDAFGGPTEEHLRALTRAVKKLLAAPATVTNAGATPEAKVDMRPPAPGPRGPGALLIAGAVLALLIVAGSVWYFAFEKPAENAKFQESADARAAQEKADEEAKIKADQQLAQEELQKVDEEKKQADQLKADAEKKANDDKAAADQLLEQQQALADKAKADKEKADTEATKIAAQKKADDDAAKAAAAAAAPFPKDGQPWQNTLAMKFVPAGTPGVLFSIYPTRVKDFSVFIDGDKPYAATAECYSVADGTYKEVGKNWKDPGFPQTPDHPVVGVSWFDAKEFCAWLTRTELAAGKIGPTQAYRLPYDDEWTRAAGTGLYPWGDAWPPPSHAANLAGDGDNISPSINGYKDGEPFTSPVWEFEPNNYGLYDMGGNVRQWCESWYKASMSTPEAIAKVSDLANDKGGQYFKVFRGGSWRVGEALPLQTNFRCAVEPNFGNVTRGFRCVLVVTPSP